MKLWVLSCLLLLAVHQSSAVCRFHDDQYFGYVCELNEVVVTTVNQSVLLNTDNHLSARNDADVTALTIGSAQLAFFPNSLLQQFPNIRYLYLENTGLTQLTPGAFAGCARIAVLYLRHNVLQSVPAGLFSDCTNLAILELSHNNITEIHEDAFIDLPNLLELDIYFNQITRIPSGMLRNQANLENFLANNNQISDIEDGAFAPLSNMIILYLHENRLTEIRPAMFGTGLQSLINLNLNSNLLTTMPRFPGGPGQLSFLYLENNLITEINEGDIPASWSSVIRLDLSRNALTTLRSEAFALLENLDVLEVDLNQIEAVDDRFFDAIPSLYTFYFFDNPCASGRFDNIRGIDQDLIARTLDSCYYNFIEPTTILTCDFVQQTDYGYTCEVSNATFRNFRDKFSLQGQHLAGLTNENVTGIRIRDSNFQRVPPTIFRTFPNLHSFQLTNSLLERVERETFEECGRVRVLDLTRNRIRRLTPHSFTNCNSVEELFLDDNQITEIAPCNTFLTNTYQAWRVSLRGNVCVDMRFESGDWIIGDAERYMYNWIHRCFSLWYTFLDDQPLV